MTPEYRRLWDVVKRWWWFLLLACVVSGISGFYAALQQPAVYQTRTTLMIGQTFDSLNPSGAELSLTQQLANMYATLANRETVRGDTAAALGLTELPKYEVRRLPETNFIEIIVTDIDPGRAQAVANELANQLILQSPTAPLPEEVERQSFVEEQLSRLQDRISATEQEITDAETELEDAVSAQEIARFTTAISALQDKLADLQGNYAALLANTNRGALNTLTIIEEAAFPQIPVGPNRLLTVAVIVATGFALAFGAAYLLEYLDDTIKTLDDVRTIRDLPILPTIPDWKSLGDSSVPVLADPRSETANGLRALATTIRHLSGEKQQRSLLITSTAPQEGKSFLASNLSVVMARHGRNVALVDADLHRPVQHELFSLAKAPGLAETLLDLQYRTATIPLHGTWREVLDDSSGISLAVLTSGSNRSGASELLSAEVMDHVLENLKAEFELVVLDGPPVLASSDSLALSTKVDGVVLVATAGKTRRKELRHAVEQLRDVNAPILGVTVNRISTSASNYYYRYQNLYRDAKDERRTESEDASVEQALDASRSRSSHKKER